MHVQWRPQRCPRACLSGGDDSKLSLYFKIGRAPRASCRCLPFNLEKMAAVSVTVFEENKVLCRGHLLRVSDVDMSLLYVSCCICLPPSFLAYKISEEKKRPPARKILSDVSRNRDLFRCGLIMCLSLKLCSWHEPASPCDSPPSLLSLDATSNMFIGSGTSGSTNGSVAPILRDQP